MIQRSALIVVTLAAVWLALGRGASLTLVPVAIIFLWKRSRGPRMFPQWMRQALLARDGGKCRYCGVKVHYLADCPDHGCDDCYQSDHRTAWADGGKTTIRNGLTACRWCNQTKSALSVDEFEDKVRARVEGLRR